MPSFLLLLHMCLDANVGSESKSDAAVIELCQIAGYIEPCECYITMPYIIFSTFGSADLSEVVLELGEGPNVTGKWV